MVRVGVDLPLRHHKLMLNFIRFVGAAINKFQSHHALRLPSPAAV